MSLLPVGIGGARSGGYEIEKSLRFRASASARLTRTFSTPTAQNIYTLNVRCKRGQLGAARYLFGASTNYNFGFNSSDQILLTIAGTAYTSTAVFRDPSAWYDITYSNTGTTYRIEVNGVVVLTGTSVTNSVFNSAVAHQLGSANSANYFDGYISDLRFIDGQYLEASDFGEFSPVTGQWVPKKYTGSYGANGFYLDFKDGTSLTTLGYDKSGNGNNWTLNNISLTAGVTYDWVDDTPSNNFCVLNTIQGEQGTVSAANLALASTTGNWQTRAGTISVSSGKWYWETTITVGGNFVSIGVDSLNRSYSLAQYVGDSATGYGFRENAQKVTAGSPTAYGASYTTNDVIGVALDLDTGELEFFKNGVSQGTAFTGLTGEFVPAFSVYTSTRAIAANFGQRPFAYSPPTGFKALCTKNLPAPQVSNGADYFDAVLDSGANIKTASEALFGNFFEWIKDRANANNHQLIDSVRGNTAVLQSNTTGAETTYSAPGGSSVGWVWRIAAGFLDVVTYTGTGVARTVAHNLGVAPAMVIATSRTQAASRHVYHTSLGALKRVFLERTDAESVSSSSWNDTAPTSSELSVGTGGGVNASGEEHVAYLFAEVEGFSKFGSYTGNGSANGLFVWCGFKPKFLMIKCSSTSGDWWMYDAERSPANPAILKLLANTDGVEDVSGEDVDLLSNGFKIRSTAAGQNANTATYIFAAFAECPINCATAR